MSYKESADAIINELGGDGNINNVVHCMTRLRFVLNDEDKVNDKKVAEIHGVAGIVRQGGQYQIIIGQDVSKYFKEIKGMLNNEYTEKDTIPEARKNKKNVIVRAIDVLASCMMPIIPALIGAGMLKILYLILAFIFPTDNSSMKLLNVISDAAFYYMPILIAYSAARRFGANPVLVATVVAVLLHPGFIDLTSSSAGVMTFLGIKVVSAHYPSTVIPAILIAWIMSYIERGVDRITPNITKGFLSPALVLLISAPVAFLLLGPLGAILGVGFASLTELVQAHFYILTMVILCGIMPFIVMTGMHWAFTPLVLGALSTPGGDTLIIPAMLVINMAQGAACIGVGLRCRGKQLKQTAYAAGFTAVFSGLTEPCMYGVNLPLKRPMIAACIASAITGLFIGIAKLSAHAYGIAALVSMPMFISEANQNNILIAAGAAVMVIILTIALTCILGFTEASAVEPDTKQSPQPPATQPESASESSVICSPLSGNVIPLKEVDDAAFSSEALGKGVGIFPEEGRIYSPFNGKVLSVFVTGHAIGLESEQGEEILIHVGIDTVKLNGKGFKAYVKEDDVVKKGDLLLEFEKDYIQSEGYDPTTLIVITNSDDYREVICTDQKHINFSEPLLKIM